MAPARKAGEGSAVPSLRKVVAELGPRQKAIGTLDTRLSEFVRGVEEKLREHVSTRVSTCIYSEQREEVGDVWVEMLTYGKWDNKWQLLIETGAVEDPDGWKTQPLSTAAREKRVQVFTGGHLEKLIREAANQLDAQIAEREKAVEIAASVIGALNLQGDDGIPYVPGGGPDDDIPF